jgi:CheY-like chemotaxis protein
MIDSSLKNANILIVDDQQANIDVLTGLLDIKGFKYYKTTRDSRLVFKLFEEFKPDILLLDLKMPHLTGFEVMTQLRVLIPANTYFPILVLTADITPESKQKALAVGASDFLTKPFDLIEVDLRIKNLLQVRYLQQQLKNQNQNLEARVKESAQKLEKNKIELKVSEEKAEQSDKLKSEILNKISQTENQKNRNEQITELKNHHTETTQHSGTILYVKDNLSNVQLVEQILKMHRPTIRLITNAYGKNAVQFAIDYASDLILLDLHLPDIHGTEVIKLLKAEPRTAEIPVVILSEDVITNQIEQLMEYGVKDYLVAPIDEVRFLTVIDEWMSKSSKK